MSILNIINQIAADPSRKVKESILQANKDNETLKAVFKATYDPTISYFIEKIPEYESPCEIGCEITLECALEELKKLSSRKFTGNRGISHLQYILNNTTEDDGFVIERIIKRDLKCGATDSTANKIWKGLIPEFPYMRCSLIKDAKFDKWDWKKGVYSQLKADGSFCNLDVIDETTVLMSTRSGTQYDSSKFKNIVDDAIKTFPVNKRLIGELTVLRDGILLPRQIGNGILNSVAKGGNFAENEVPVFDIWDILDFDQVVPSGRIDIPYHQRYDDLKTLIDASQVNSIQIIETRIVYSLDEAYEHYFELIAKDLEGTIIKNPDGGWFDGTSRDQIKLKVRFECDLEIVDFNPGEGKNSNTWGSMLCKSSDDLLRVNVNGRSDEMRADFHSRRDSLIGRIITVESGLILPVGDRKDGRRSLFLPTFLELREDKTEADSLQHIINQFESVIKKK